MKVVVGYNHFPQVGPQAAKLIDQAMADGAAQITADAQRIVPVDTGRLRASIRPARLGQAQWEVAPHTDYAGFVEFGTRNQPAQPYLRPSFERNRVSIIANVQKALGNLR